MNQIFTFWYEFPFFIQKICDLNCIYFNISLKCLLPSNRKFILHKIDTKFGIIRKNTEEIFFLLVRLHEHQQTKNKDLFIESVLSQIIFFTESIEFYLHTKIDISYTIYVRCGCSMLQFRRKSYWSIISWLHLSLFMSLLWRKKNTATIPQKDNCLLKRKP